MILVSVESLRVRFNGEICRATRLGRSRTRSCRLLWRLAICKGGRLSHSQDCRDRAYFREHLGLPTDQSKARHTWRLYAACLETSSCSTNSSLFIRLEDPRKYYSGKPGVILQYSLGARSRGSQTREQRQQPMY